MAGDRSVERRADHGKCIEKLASNAWLWSTMAGRKTDKRHRTIGDEPVSTVDLDVPDIGDPMLEGQIALDLTLIRWVLRLGLGLFVVWIIAMILLP